MQGWVKLHRNIMQSDTFSKLNAIQQLITIYIILNANHEDGVWYDKYKNIEVPIKRGQLITSRKKIVNEWFKGDKEVTEQKVRTTLKKLEQLGFLTTRATNNYTLIEVLNYDVYQKRDNETNQRNNQEITNKQPRDNQDLTTNKNDKNVKNLSSSNNSDSDFAEVMKFYQENLQKSITESPFNIELIQQWFDEWEKDLLLAAMKLAAQREAKGTAFVEGVLKNWKDAGVNNLEQARQYQIQFKQSTKKTYNNVTPFKPKEEQADDDYDYGF